MIVKGNEVQDKSIIETDLCIIGGGTAGIGMALQFVKMNISVTLLEGGGFEPDDKTKDLADGKNIGVPYFKLGDARPRYLGGGTNLWAGWCRPFDEIDFEKRDWVPYSGWPISKKDIDPYYDRAKQLCEIAGKSFAAGDWPHAIPDLYKAPFASEEIPATVWVGSPPTKFGDVYRKDLEQAENIKVYMKSNVTELVTDEAGELILAAKAGTLAGNTFEVRSKLFVLVPGAIEAARILLRSSQGGRKGIGNEHDVVGRYFMEHPHLVTAKIHLFDRKKVTRAIIPALDFSFIKGAKARLLLERPTYGVKFAYTINEKAQRANQLLNFSAHLRTASPSRDSDAYRSLKLIIANMRSGKAILKQIRKGAIPDGLGTQMKNIVSNPGEIYNIIYKQVFSRPNVLELYTQSEQAPNPNSRILIDHNERDLLGVPRAKLDWRFSLIDKVSIRNAQKLVGDHLRACGIGELVSEPWVEDDPADWDPSLIGGYHHLGTTRMGKNKKESVVDENCKLHSVRNLFVTSTAAFPTGGYANPLLTGLALALRTSDFVKDALKQNIKL